MNMNEKNKIENCRIEPKLKLINMDSVEVEQDRKSTRLNSSHSGQSRMPSSA